MVRLWLRATFAQSKISSSYGIGLAQLIRRTMWKSFQRSVRGVLRMIKSINAFALALLIVSALLFAGATDFEAETQQQDLYCEMTGYWLEDSHLPPEERRGWPEYNKSIDCGVRT